jgi:hypothetical protein
MCLGDGNVAAVHVEEKPNTYTLTLTEATLTSNTCILTEEQLFTLYHMVMNIDNIDPP